LRAKIYKIRAIILPFFITGIVFSSLPAVAVPPDPDDPRDVWYEEKVKVTPCYGGDANITVWVFNGTDEELALIDVYMILTDRPNEMVKDLIYHVADFQGASIPIEPGQAIRAQIYPFKDLDGRNGYVYYKRHYEIEVLLKGNGFWCEADSRPFYLTVNMPHELYVDPSLIPITPIP